jgi:hypothetical protein
MPFPDVTRLEALTRSKRHCCVCRVFGGRDIVVHHIVQEADGGANTLDNAIALCSRCHSEAGHYNPRHPLGTKYSPEELRRHRDSWWDVCNSQPADGPPFMASRMPGSVRKKVGVIWSQRADIAADHEVVVFDAVLLGSTRLENYALVRFLSLYRRGTEYGVYEEVNHRGDWAEASMHAWMSLEDVQQQFPALAAECGLPRERRL